MQHAMKSKTYAQRLGYHSASENLQCILNSHTVL